MPKHKPSKTKYMTNLVPNDVIKQVYKTLSYIYLGRGIRKKNTFLWLELGLGTGLGYRFAYRKMFIMSTHGNNRRFRNTTLD